MNAMKPVRFDIPEELHKKLKVTSARVGKSMRKITILAIEQFIKEVK